MTVKSNLILQKLGVVCINKNGKISYLVTNNPTVVRRLAEQPFLRL